MLPPKPAVERGSYLLFCRIPVASPRRPWLASSWAEVVVGVKLITLAERMPVIALVRSEPPRSLAAFIRVRRWSRSADHSVVLKPERPSYFEKKEDTVFAGVQGLQPGSPRAAGTQREKEGGV